MLLVTFTVLILLTFVLFCVALAFTLDEEHRGPGWRIAMLSFWILFIAFLTGAWKVANMMGRCIEGNIL